jgi:hypothetical protein
MNAMAKRIDTYASAAAINMSLSLARSTATAAQMPDLIAKERSVSCGPNRQETAMIESSKNGQTRNGSRKLVDAA